MTRTTTKPATVAAVREATKRASIPKRPVIEHTKLFRAELQVQQRSANDALASADRALAFAASERDEAMEAAKRAYDDACALISQRFDTIRTEVDAERDDILRSIDGIEAALKAIEPKPANIVALAA